MAKNKEINIKYFLNVVNKHKDYIVIVGMIKLTSRNNISVFYKNKLLLSIFFSSPNFLDTIVISMINDRGTFYEFAFNEGLRISEIYNFYINYENINWSDSKFSQYKISKVVNTAPLCVMAAINEQYLPCYKYTRKRQYTRKCKKS